MLSDLVLAPVVDCVAAVSIAGFEDDFPVAFLIIISGKAKVIYSDVDIHATKSISNDFIPYLLHHRTPATF